MLRNLKWLQKSTAAVVKKNKCKMGDFLNWLHYHRGVCNSFQSQLRWVASSEAGMERS